MSSVNNPAEKNLAALGIASAEQVQSLFADLRSRLDSEAASVSDATSLKTFRDAWFGRKSGVLTLVADNWLKPASAELKRSVGQELNKFKAHAQSVLT
jgi:hypothetical protein